MSRTIMIWKNTTLAIVAALAIAAPLSISCEEDDGVTEVPADDAPEAVANTVCHRYFACECEMIEDATRFTSEDDCQLALAGDLQGDIDEGREAGLTYNDRCAGLQIELADRLACQSFGEVILDLELAALNEDYENCKWFYGERGPGQSCERLQESNGDDCEVDLVCSNDDICITREDGLGEGEECNPLPSDCAAGLACIDIDGGPNNPTCESLPRGGETCKGTSNLCDIDFACDIEAKTCVALPGVGTACATMGSVLGWTCERGAVCDEDTDECIAAPAGGEPCNGMCVTGFSCDQGRCAEDPGIICLADAGA